MNSSKPNDAREIKTADRPLDPFAVDFFGDKKLAAAKEKNSGPTESQPTNGDKKPAVESGQWFENLPRLTRGEYQFSGRIEKLPDNLTKAAAHKISEIITRYTFQAPKSVRCQMISITEVDLAKTLVQLEKSPQTFLAFGCRPGSSAALAAFDTGFASSVIDLILSGRGEALSVPRRLSPIENTIVEFLGGNVLAGINDWIGENLFWLRSAENEFDDLFAKGERGAEAVFRLDFAEFSGIITVLAPVDFLGSVDKTGNPLLNKKNGRDDLAALEKFVPELGLRVRVGTTALDAGSLAYLETGDIVLVERALAGFRNSEFFGTGSVSIGGGENFRLSGEFLMTDAPGGLNGKTNFKLEEIKSFPVRRNINREGLEMEKMNNENTEEAKTVGAEEDTAGTAAAADAEVAADVPAIENVLVNLRVEIAGDKLSLSEIQRLRKGQIINLGCRPTDPVRLVIDTSDQPIAVGELVDIEGQLGVRLTRIFI